MSASTMTTHKVTISSITERGVHPQFYRTFARAEDADRYAGDFLKEAAKAGVMVRIDRDPKQLNTTNGDSK